MPMPDKAKSKNQKKALAKEPIEVLRIFPPATEKCLALGPWAKGISSIIQKGLMEAFKLSAGLCPNRHLLDNII
jgi:hypothetical protein